MSDDLRPRKARRAVADDDGARCVVALLKDFAARVTAAVKREPAIVPPDGMARLGNRDRASYVWFLPCAEAARTADGSRPETCNHGIGIDRVYGAYEVRAWAHGAPTVHDLSLHTHVVTKDHLETAAKLIGLPFQPEPPKLVAWVHGTNLGRGHTSLRQHLFEDHGTPPSEIEGWSDGAVHGLHDALHNQTWAYAADLPHPAAQQPYPQEYSFSDPEGA